MGGFGFRYVEGSAQTIFTGITSDYGGGDAGVPMFRDIDATRKLMMWYDGNWTGRVRFAVISITGDTFTIGPVVLLNDSGYNLAGDPAFSLSRTGANEFVLAVSPFGSGGPLYSIVTVSGATVSATPVVYFGSLPSLPPAWYASPPAGYTGGFYDGTDVAPVAIDSDHIIMPIIPYWQKSTAPFGLIYRPFLAILELSTSTWIDYIEVAVEYDFTDAYPQYQFIEGDGLAGKCYYQVEYTDTYYVQATPSAITFTIVGSGLLDGIVLEDGAWWGFVNDGVVANTWSPTDQWEERFPLYRLDGASADAQTMQTEASSGVLQFFTSMAQLVDDVWVACFSPGILGSFKNGNEHVRAERQGLNLPVPDGLGYRIVNNAYRQCVTRLSATSSKLLIVYVDGGTNVSDPPYHAVAAIIEEVPLPPAVVFTVSPDIGEVPLPVTFDARQTIDYTRDGYWHPITEWRWEFDDRDTDTTTGPLVTHLYIHSSLGHMSGANLSELPVGPVLTGFRDYYLPTLRVTSAAGDSPVTEQDILFIGDAPYLVGGAGPSNARFLPNGV